MDALLGYLTEHCCAGEPCGVTPRATALTAVCSTC